MPCTSPRWNAVKCSLTTTRQPNRRANSTAGKPASNTCAWMISGRQRIRRIARSMPISCVAIAAARTRGRR